MTPAAPTLFDAPPAGPEGFRYQPELVSPAEEAALAARFAGLPFVLFEFRGVVARRRIVSFGWRYDFGQGRLHPGEPIPDFLLPLREQAAAFGGLAPEALEQVLINEYRPGAPIGWHRDRPEFGDVAGVSLLASAPLRFRRRRGERWERLTVPLARRSAYLLSGPARSEWEHSLPQATALRYSVTFRTLRLRR